MKEMIKKYRGSLISSILVILAGVLVGFTSTHGKWINVFFVVTHCIFVAIIFYDNRSRQQSPKVIGMTIWMIPVITLLYNGIARLVNTGAGMENLFMAFMYYGTGLLFMVIGNYLPKVKQNNTIGIRVIWTLQDEENWNATHRFSGKLWMASGILCMLCGLFEESMAALVLYIVSIMAAAIISILYSYLFYKKKIATGEKLKIQYNKKIRRMSSVRKTLFGRDCCQSQFKVNKFDKNGITWYNKTRYSFYDIKRRKAPFGSKRSSFKWNL